VESIILHFGMTLCSEINYRCSIGKVLKAHAHVHRKKSAKINMQCRVACRWLSSRSEYVDAIEKPSRRKKNHFFVFVFLFFVLLFCIFLCTAQNICVHIYGLSTSSTVKKGKYTKWIKIKPVEKYVIDLNYIKLDVFGGKKGRRMINRRIMDGCMFCHDLNTF
jgi:hypothetical protein